ncbi:nicotinamide mononucleotide transporter [Solibaculum intestinale]|uniref:Nicotinamide mononucleotide transporter n=1 Tax=Solibaculum intestinale TaxID=3133165 RepID=A0ABV1E2N7_9FIRM
MNYIAYAVTVASIVGTVANSFQKRWCFWVWGCTNAFWCVFNILSGSYAQAILYAFNFAMAVVGLAKWSKKDARIRRAFKIAIRAAAGVHSPSLGRVVKISDIWKQPNYERVDINERK